MTGLPPTGRLLSFTQADDWRLMRYRADVDGLRALAVVPVILFHYGFKDFSGGFVGVDVFFVISGYLITSLIHSELEADEFSLVAFYERRFRRILPSLFLVITCTTIVAFFRKRSINPALA